jgi:hypothetical protein
LAITIHELAALKYFSDRQALGRVATLGRQTLMLTPEQLDLVKKIEGPVGTSEDLLSRVFGAESVDSLDFSDYEGASRIVDLSVPTDIVGEYDTLIDFGTTEHVFDVAQCFRNIIKMTKIGGQIIHALPANNFYGHGLWQICPDLYFSLYSQANGFDQTEVFLVDYGQTSYWRKLKPIRASERHSIDSKIQAGLIVRTKKIAQKMQLSVYQSDYKSQWEVEEKGSSVSGSTEVVKSTTSLLRRVVKRIPYAKAFYSRVLAQPTDDEKYSIFELRKVFQTSGIIN